MKIEERSIKWYINQLEKPFSFPGYSDAEWFCMIGEREGSRTGYGQLLTTKVAEALIKPLHLAHGRFYPAFPKEILSFPQGKKIKGFAQNFSVTWYERDIVTDDLAREAKLHPFIQKLQEKRVGIVGNSHLRKLEFLNYKEFCEIDEQDFHLRPKRMDQTVQKIIKGSCDIYLFSAGISATIMIGQLHGKVNATLFDCGSMWDAFVGIGGQREWRAELYKDQKKWDDWKNRNLYGKS